MAIFGPPDALTARGAGGVQASAVPEAPPATGLRRPVIVGHRGSPGYRPEHTAAGYELAIELGADVIEPDVVVSRDGALVARHENELSRSTDIASRPQFADRRTTKEVDGAELTGWFTEDFTLAELRTLRAVERMPGLRPLNTPYDGRFGIMTLADVVGLARRRSTPERPIRVLAELKHPTWSADQGLPVTELVAAELCRLGASGPDGVAVQSFDAAALRRLRTRLDGLTMLQLIGGTAEYDPMTTPAGLREISTYAQGIAPCRHRLILRDDHDAMTGVSDLVGRAHSAGLWVIPWTVRAENAFLPRHLRRGSDSAGLGDAVSEVGILLGLGVDGLITDHPDVAARARCRLIAAQGAPSASDAWPFHRTDRPFESKGPGGVRDRGRRRPRPGRARM
jgi:glycerophosphoryl diester phosphodiesterase